jgi:hypothetical protein
MTVAEKILEFYRQLEIRDPLPEGVEVMNPYADPACFQVCNTFYQKFYNDTHTRFLILGINPGRYGAGITGIPFTDPIKLESFFDIENTLPKKPELSAEFIHKMIAAFGGYNDFFSTFLINSVSPLGFIQNGKNLNYYDTPVLRRALDPFIRKSLRALTAIGVRREVVFCLGEGENYKQIRSLNEEEKLFAEIIPLAHPRFVMQYKRKHLSHYIDDYVNKLTRYL